MSKYFLPALVLAFTAPGCVFPVAVPQTYPFATELDDSDEEILRKMADYVAQAYRETDLEGFLSLWHPASPEYNLYRDLLKDEFTRFPRIEVRTLHVETRIGRRQAELVWDAEFRQWGEGSMGFVKPVSVIFTFKPHHGEARIYDVEVRPLRDLPAPGPIARLEPELERAIERFFAEQVNDAASLLHPASPLRGGSPPRPRVTKIESIASRKITRAAGETRVAIEGEALVGGPVTSSLSRASRTTFRLTRIGRVWRITAMSVSALPE